MKLLPYNMSEYASIPVDVCYSEKLLRLQSSLNRRKYPKKKTPKKLETK